MKLVRAQAFKFEPRTLPILNDKERGAETPFQGPSPPNSFDSLGVRKTDFSGQIACAPHHCTIYVGVALIALNELISKRYLSVVVDRVTGRDPAPSLLQKSPSAHHVPAMTVKILHHCKPEMRGWSVERTCFYCDL